MIQTKYLHILQLYQTTKRRQCVPFQIDTENRGQCVPFYTIDYTITTTTILLLQLLYYYCNYDTITATTVLLLQLLYYYCNYYTITATTILLLLLPHYTILLWLWLLANLRRCLNLVPLPKSITRILKFGKSISRTSEKLLCPRCSDMKSSHNLGKEEPHHLTQTNQSKHSTHITWHKLTNQNTVHCTPLPP